MTTTLHLRFFSLMLIAVFAFGACMPAAAQAATSTRTATATLTTTSLNAKSNTKVVLSGTTQNTKKITFIIRSENGSRTFFKSKTISVRNGKWNSTVSKKLKDGAYTVTVYNADGKNKKSLNKGTLVVGKPAAILKVSTIPLLGGGTATPGQSVPVSYLQVTNTSASKVTLKGFRLEQRGTAGDASVTGFSSVDDKGGSRAMTTSEKPLSKGKAFVPSTAVLLPGERKLFTIKANVSPRTGTYTNQTLMLDVTGIDANATLNGTFPIRGTVWVIGG